MSLDFHTTPENAPPFSASLFRLSLDQHTALFDAIRSDEAYKQLSAMRDYYSDTSYSGDDLRALILELREIAASPNASAMARDTALGLQCVSEQVLSSGESLYAVAD